VKQVISSTMKMQALLASPGEPSAESLKAAIAKVGQAAEGMAQRQKEVAKRTAPRCGLEESVFQTFTHHINNTVMNPVTRVNVASVLIKKYGRKKEAENIQSGVSQAISTWGKLGSVENFVLYSHGPFVIFDLENNGAVTPLQTASASQARPSQ